MDFFFSDGFFYVCLALMLIAGYVYDRLTV